MWKITEVQEEDAWLDDYVRTVIATPAPSLPAKVQQIGTTSATWFESEPGVAVIFADGESQSDELLASWVLREQLRAHGYRHAQFTLDGDEELRKTADWNDIQAKARRLIQSGNVQLNRNGYNEVAATVKGDHGTYDVMINRDDPNSRAITQWKCTCPWDQFAWQRTRQWKKYEGRSCAHVLAAFWASQGTPIDEEAHPENQQQLFPSGPMAPYQLKSRPGMPAPAPQGEQMGMFDMDPAQVPPGGPPGGMATGAPPVPSGPPPAGPSTLPQFPMDPALQPVVNPVSVPGQKPPSPLNPIQWPGGTFSNVRGSWYDPRVATEFNEQPEGFQNGNMVQLLKQDVGVAEGKSEAHGSGQYRTINAGSVGEVLGVDPTTGWVDVIFPIHDSGPMEPYHIRGFFEPSALKPRPDIARPGPFIKRRR